MIISELKPWSMWDRKHDHFFLKAWSPKDRIYDQQQALSMIKVGTQFIHRTHFSFSNFVRIPSRHLDFLFGKMIKSWPDIRLFHKILADFLSDGRLAKIVFSGAISMLVMKAWSWWDVCVSTCDSPLFSVENSGTSDSEAFLYLTLSVR